MRRCQLNYRYKLRAWATVRLSAFMLFILIGQTFNSYADAPLPAIIEVTAKAGTVLNPGKLVTLGRQYHLPAQSIYQWKNHLVVYSRLNNSSVLSRQITSLYPNAA